MSASRFTVIVVNYNGGEMLAACAQSLLDHGLPGRHLIVIDNGSRDDSLHCLQRLIPECQIIRMGCNAGFARAVNRGLAITQTEFALLLNNDARLEQGALNALAEHFDHHPRAAFAGGRLLYADGRPQNAIAPLPTLWGEMIPKGLRRLMAPKRYDSRPQTDAPIEVESLIGALFAIRMDAAWTLGFLDEDFFFFLEETEWCYRARKHHWQVWHVPAARAVHAQGGTAKRYHALARIEYQRSKLLYYRKTIPHLYPAALAILLLKALTNALAHGLGLALGAALMVRQRQKAMVYFRILGWYLQGRPEHVGLPDKCPKI
ncbi:MAG: glycosyltransferase [Halothiobacillaceae bacterium]